MNFYKHHLGDYAAATSHLSWDEDCAYRRLIDQYYKRETPIPADMKAACRLARAASVTQRRAVEAVLAEFFFQTEDGSHQKRCDIEIAAANAQAETNRRVSDEREARKRERIVHESLNESLNESCSDRQPSQTPDSRLQTPEKEKDASATADVCSPTNGAHHFPACPVNEIIELYHRELPALPRLTVRNTKRDKLIGARWRQVFVDGKAHDKPEGIELFRQFFDFVRDSKFLTGRSQPSSKDRTPFVADLEWLMLPTNFAKTVEGKYHR